MLANGRARRSRRGHGALSNTAKNFLRLSSDKAGRRSDGFHGTVRPLPCPTRQRRRRHLPGLDRSTKIQTRRQRRLYPGCLYPFWSRPFRAAFLFQNGISSSSAAAGISSSDVAGLPFLALRNSSSRARISTMLWFTPSLSCQVRCCNCPRTPTLPFDDPSLVINPPKLLKRNLEPLLIRGDEVVGNLVHPFQQTSDTKDIPAHESPLNV